MESKIVYKFGPFEAKVHDLQNNGQHEIGGIASYDIYYPEFDPQHGGEEPIDTFIGTAFQLRRHMRLLKACYDIGLRRGHKDGSAYMTKAARLVHEALS